MNTGRLRGPVTEADNRMHFEELDGVILNLLIGSHSPWTVEEVVREVGEPEYAVTDATGRLTRAGMIHRIDGDYLVPSVSGRYAAVLGGMDA